MHGRTSPLHIFFIHKVKVSSSEKLPTDLLTNQIHCTVTGFQQTMAGTKRKVLLEISGSSRH